MFSRLTSSLAFVSAVAFVSCASQAAERTRLAAADVTGTPVAPAVSNPQTPEGTSKLEVAAELGVLNAQLKLARKYAVGDGVAANQKQAFDIYQRIIRDHADVRPSYGSAQGVARAVVALGNYYRVGIPGALEADKSRAVMLLHYASSYLGNADAQFDLAQMYLKGEGVQRNVRLALSWLANASKKRHGHSQALLGELLWRGSKSIPRQAEKGLALMALALQNVADEAEAQRIADLYEDALMQSKADVRERAQELAELWQDTMGRPGVARIVGSEPAPEADTKVSTGVPADDGVAPVSLEDSNAQR